MPPRVGFNAGFWSQPVDALKSQCLMTQDQLLADIELCFHLAVPWCRTDSLAVPLPVTKQAAAAYYTNVFKAGSQLAMFETICYKVKEDYRHRVVAIPHKSNNPARYAEIVLFRRDSIDGPTTPSGTEWEAMFVRALPVPDVPPKPEHMVAHLHGQEASKYPYTSADFIKSIAFWQQYASVK